MGVTEGHFLHALVMVLVSAHEKGMAGTSSAVVAFQLAHLAVPVTEWRVEPQATEHVVTGVDTCSQLAAFAAQSLP
ncbi:hypothetical protein D2E76_01715 [Mycobacteroides abscessus]|uniref:Uncharacterized protein n=2 Tax=Mycobacteroides abscessus TaxID=36809 RepID=A0ABD7HVC0_9MYCO|nr:hypothetical protein D2E39_16310 [Mycobacteroides abscessus]RIS50672.1 hypothetical protein D2E43_22465 [Mycobacteroides abscessus]RIT43789.1 hypothetical protein D2E76_01715 [Mycobacteroides abscessus]